jgi:hypothetical protein
MQCHWHRIDGACRVRDTACTTRAGPFTASMLNFVKQNECRIIEIACTMHAVSLTPLAIYDTACTICEQFLGPWQPFKENIYQKHICTRLVPPSTTKYKFLKELPNKNVVHWHSMPKNRRFHSRTSSRIWSRIRKSLVRESGAQGRFFGENPKGI